MFGLIVPDIMNSYFEKISKSLAAKIRPSGYDVVICNSEENAELETAEIERLLGRQIDGLVLASAQLSASASVFERLEARGVPYVLIDRQFKNLDASYVGSDDQEIGRMATAHLIDRGCRRIAHLAAEERLPGSGRRAGYREALKAAGLPNREEYVAQATDDATGYEATRKLLALGERPDAVFGYNDPTAAGAMKAILEAGLRIPQDMKVIGVGNVHYSDLLRVPLSTIDQNSNTIGEHAADILLKAVGSKRKRNAKSVIVEPRLMPRESTAV